MENHGIPHVQLRKLTGPGARCFQEKCSRAHEIPGEVEVSSLAWRGFSPFCCWHCIIDIKYINSFDVSILILIDIIWHWEQEQLRDEDVLSKLGTVASEQSTTRPSRNYRALTLRNGMKAVACCCYSFKLHSPPDVFYKLMVSEMLAFLSFCCLFCFVLFRFCCYVMSGQVRSCQVLQVMLCYTSYVVLDMISYVMLYKLCHVMSCYVVSCYLNLFGWLVGFAFVLLCLLPCCCCCCCCCCQVLLASDPEAITSAAALSVHLGFYSDPEDLPGLAHFCESLEMAEEIQQISEEHGLCFWYFGLKDNGIVKTMFYNEFQTIKNPTLGVVGGLSPQSLFDGSLRHMLFLGTKEYPEENSFERFLTANSGSQNAFTTEARQNAWKQPVSSSSQLKTPLESSKFSSSQKHHCVYLRLICLLMPSLI